jgi:glucose-6-phosphate-specific signal transduction histidine kinase
MNEAMIERDERTVVVENASYRLAYLVMSYGLLLVVAYRALEWRQSNWDLVALVVVGGLAATIYQGAHRVLSRRWWLTAIVTAVVAAVVAAGMTYLASNR